MPDGEFVPAIHMHIRLHPAQVLGFQAETIVRHRPAERRRELLLQLRQLDAILRPLRARHARQHRRQVQLHFARICDVALLRNAPQTLRLVIILVRLDRFLAAARRAQVVDAFLVDREETHRRAVFRRHVRDCRAVHHRQRRRARTVEFHELAHHLRLAQHLRHRQRQVRGRHTFAQRARQVHAHHVRRQEINRLAQHPRLRLDAAHAPAHDADAVDHRRVRIRAHQRVRIIHLARVQHALGQIFQVHLMHDADARRHHLERVKRLHAPLQKLIALPVAREFQVQILRQRIRPAREIHLHRVIHHQIHRHQRLDDLRVLAQQRNRAAHRRQVHQQRHPREVLEHNARHHERDLRRARLHRLPVRQLLHIRLRHLLAVTVAQHRFQHQPDGHRQPGNRPHPRLFQGRQRIKFPRLAVAEREALQRAVQVV